MSQVVFTSAAECGFKIPPLTPYSPDMAPFVFCLFQKLKFHLRGSHNGSNKGVINAVNEYLGDKEKAFYFDGILKLKQR